MQFFSPRALQSRRTSIKSAPFFLVPASDRHKIVFAKFQVLRPGCCPRPPHKPHRSPDQMALAAYRGLLRAAGSGRCSRRANAVGLGRGVCTAAQPPPEPPVPASAAAFKGDTFMLTAARAEIRGKFEVRSAAPSARAHAPPAAAVQLYTLPSGAHLLLRKEHAVPLARPCAGRPSALHSRCLLSRRGELPLLYHVRCPPARPPAAGRAGRVGPAAAGVAARGGAGGGRVHPHLHRAGSHERARQLWWAGRGGAAALAGRPASGRARPPA